MYLTCLAAWLLAAPGKRCWRKSEAIAFHIESLREHGEPVPEPQSTAEVVDVGAVMAE